MHIKTLTFSRKQYLMLSVLMLAGFLYIAIAWAFTFWQARFLDSLAAFDKKLFVTLMFTLPLFLLAESTLEWFGHWYSGVTSNRLRIAFFEELGKNIFFPKLSKYLQNNGPNDPVQRLTEDVKIYSVSIGDLVYGFAKSMAMLFFFGATLVLIIPKIEVSHDSGFNVHAPMLLVALLTFGMSSIIIQKIGHQFSSKLNLITAEEAALREALQTNHAHGVEVTMLKGQSLEFQLSRESIQRITTWKIQLANIKGRMAAASTWLGPSDIIALMIASTFYFSGKISLGQLFQIGVAHKMMGGALDWFVKSFAEIASMKASKQRLIDWCIANEESNKSLEALSNKYSISPAIVFMGMPKEKCHFIKIENEFNLDTKRKVLLRAPSGAGKSTLFAALSGAAQSYPNITLPANCVFIPQKNYFRRGTLLSVLLYPMHLDAIDNLNAVIAEVETMLSSIGLEHLIVDINNVSDWQTKLSLGECAKVALVRALLQKPAYLLLDEPTASLDDESANKYWSLLNAYPEIGVVLISHGRHCLNGHVDTIDLDVTKKISQA